MRPILALLALLVAAPAAAVPLTFSHQGRLLDASGAPLDATHTIDVSLYDAPAGGAALWTEQHDAPFDNGFFSLRLGSVNALEAALLAGDRWMGIAIDGGAELPVRLPLDSVPFAVLSLQSEHAASADHATSADSATASTHAATADHADTADRATAADRADALAPGATVDLSEVSIGGATVIASDGSIDWQWIDNAPTQLDDLDCASDQVPLYDGSAWSCGELASSGVSSITAGDGLTGGTITDDGTLAIAEDGVTAAMLKADDDSLEKLTGGFLRKTSHGGLRVGNSIYNAWSGAMPGAFNGTSYATGPLQMKTALRCENGNGIGYMWHVEFIGHEFNQDRPFRTVSVGYSQHSYPAEIQDHGSTEDYGDLGVNAYCSTADSSGRKFLSFELVLKRQWHASDLTVNVLHGGSGYQKTFSDRFAVTATREGARY